MKSAAVLRELADWIDGETVGRIPNRPSAAVGEAAASGATDGPQANREAQAGEAGKFVAEAPGPRQLLASVRGGEPATEAQAPPADV